MLSLVGWQESNVQLSWYTHMVLGNENSCLKKLVLKAGNGLNAEITFRGSVRELVVPELILRGIYDTNEEKKELEHLTSVRGNYSRNRGLQDDVIKFGFKDGFLSFYYSEC
ncbi:hypothetical protein HK098_005961 [Nowakowskiella sp. JEL0407]|nr:hypothetical protein HK098_005961 [Nowakowskiella sp. JEL0407]